MSEGCRPSAPFIVVGAVAEGNATAVMQSMVSALNNVGAQVVSSQEEHNSVTLVSPDAGPLILRCMSDEIAEPYVGVELWVSGDLLGGPSWIELEPDEIAQRERVRAFVQSAFLSTCDRLRPLYAGVGVEWTVVLPGKLESEGVCLPGDLFWSSQLEEIDGTLAPDLAAIYGSGSRTFSHGALIKAGSVLDTASQTPPQPRAAGRAAAKRLARSLARLEK
jgi:hypothetical protein